MKSTPTKEKVPYTFEFAPMYREIALKYLHETDNIRTQALDQFREWITKDPTITNCRMDSSFLLRFLRTKKFNIAAAYQIFKEYLTAFRLYPKWFMKLCVDEPHIIDFILDGFIYPLPERDENGCQVVIYNFGNINPDKYTQHDIFRVQILCFHACFEDEESQIAGYVVVLNFSGYDMKRYALFNFVDFSNYARVVRYAIPIRVNKILIMNMPRYMHPLYELASSFLTPKLKKRVQLIKSREDFKKVVDISIYPKEFGGGRELSDILQEFMKKMQSIREPIRQLSDMSIELPSHMNKEWYLSDSNGRLGTGMVGSFRRLAVD